MPIKWADNGPRRQIYIREIPYLEAQFYGTDLIITFGLPCDCLHRSELPRRRKTNSHKPGYNTGVLGVANETLIIYIYTYYIYSYIYNYVYTISIILIFTIWLIDRS